MLNTLKSVPNEDPAYHYFSPEDLALMRHAYHGLRGAADGGANSSAAADFGQGHRRGF